MLAPKQNEIEDICGTGGHTTEMMNVVRALDFDVYTPRCYVNAETDTLSGSKAVRLETLKVRHKLFSWKLCISFLSLDRS